MRTELDRKASTAAAPSLVALESAWPEVRHVDQETNRINLSWLLKLRWGAVAGQAATILYVHFAMRISLPLTALLAIVGLELASNIGLLFWMRRHPPIRESVVVAVMATDILILTGLLYFTGGAFNPFSFLYLVHISLAAVVLRSWWTWGLVALSVACLGALFIDHRWLEIGWHEHPERHTEHVSLHLHGMWIAMGVAGVFIVYFVTRVTRDLARRERELARTRVLAARGEKLASLATLAAGAAHELSTPLSTIAVVANELEHAMERLSADAETVSDVRLVRKEVERCRDILQQMAADAGEGAGEAFTWAAVEDVIKEAMDGVAGPQRFEVEMGEGVAGRRVFAPFRALAQAIRGVLKNAEQAASREGMVRVRVEHDTRTCRVEVVDSGSGMVPGVLERAGEPFFTTKDPGSGMGLGLFLTRAVLERLGGAVDISSAPGSGTRVLLAIPVGDFAAASASTLEQVGVTR